MTKASKRIIQVFIASPGDLVEERNAFRKTIDGLNIGFGDGAGVEYVALGWEDTLASTGRRNQSVINEDIDTCDVFILAMFRRWGQTAADAKPYSSYTEEEFHRAFERWKKTQAPEIFVFFKHVDTASEADPGPQLREVIKFRKQLEETRQVLYRYFDSSDSFSKEVDTHLRAYAKGELPKVDQNPNPVILPMAVLEEVEKAKQIAIQKTEEAQKAHDTAKAVQSQLEATQLEIAEDAAKLSKEGKLEFAREKLTKLVTETTNLRILSLGYDFFRRTGDIDSALKVLEKWLNLSGPDCITVETAKALGNLGVIYQLRGKLYRAEDRHQKALNINETLGCKEGMASDYNHLGNLYLLRGELKQAEEMYQKALAINEAMGHKEGMVKDYGNLGVLYATRSELNQAEVMYRKALLMNETLERAEGIAKQYGNLGSIYLTRGELTQAEDMFRKALAINETLGHKEGLANDYGNLGVLYSSRGELGHAQDMYLKALAMNETLGRLEGIANQYGNLGILYKTIGELNNSEEMYRKALTIHKTLGHKKGMAIDYTNLGNLYSIRNEFNKSEEMYEKALKINESLGRKEGIATIFSNLGEIYLNQSKINEAEDMLQKALSLFQEIQSPKAKHVENLLKELRGQEL